MTKGEKIVRITGNNGKEVVQLKTQVKFIIDSLEKKRRDVNTNPVNSEKQRLISIAQTKLEEACMFAVKAITTP